MVGAMNQTDGRVAVVLCSLGGPDSLEAVRPFLFNLFNDPAILSAPGPVR
jgi:ferrochelatase